MHIPLVISILALLAFALLPVLDRSANSKINAPGHALTGSVSHVGRRSEPCEIGFSLCASDAVNWKAKRPSWLSAEIALSQRGERYSDVMGDRKAAHCEHVRHRVQHL